MKGYVYFASDVLDVGPIKIGFTMGSVPARLVSLQTGCPFRLKEIFSFKASAHVERSIHALCEAYREHGEWYKRHPRIFEAIEAARGGDFAILEDPNKRAEFVDDETALQPEKPVMPLQMTGTTAPKAETSPLAADQPPTSGRRR